MTIERMSIGAPEICPSGQAERDGFHHDGVAVEDRRRHLAVAIGQPIEIVVPKAERVDRHAGVVTSDCQRDDRRDEDDARRRRPRSFAPGFELDRRWLLRAPAQLSKMTRT